MNDIGCCNCSKLEAMILELLDKGRLHFVFHALSAEVTIEHSSSSPESILFVFKIVCLHMIYKSRSHVCVVLAWAKTWEHVRSHRFVNVCSKCPAWCNDYQEVKHNKGHSLLRVLDEWRVKMHMVLRVEVMIDHSVDILQLYQASVLVGL